VANSNRRFGTTYRSHLQGPKNAWRLLKMGPIVSPETSARNCHYLLRNNPEERISRVNKFSTPVSFLTQLNPVQTFILNYLLTELLTYLLTYLLTPWSRILLEKLTSSLQVKQFPAFYGTRRSIISFTSVRHLSLSWARLIQSMPPHLTAWRSILILSSYLCLSLPSGHIPSGFLTKTLCTTLPLPISDTWPTHLTHIRIIFIKNLILIVTTHPR